MLSNIQIETWTREQCEGYLKEFPDSLKSDAVRKQLRALQPPKPQPTQPLPPQKKAENNINVADVVGAVKPTKTDSKQHPSNQTHTFFCKECGNESPDWFSKCPACGTWNTCMEKTSIKKSIEQKPQNSKESKEGNKVSNSSGSKKSFGEVANKLFWGIGSAIFTIGLIMTQCS